MDEVKDGTSEVLTDEAKPDESKEEKKEGKQDAKPDETKTAKEDKFIAEVLDEYGLDSPEDLKDFISNLSSLKEELGDYSLEELKENAQLMEKYQKYWAAEESKKKEEDETPEETIARLKKEKESIAKTLKREKEEQEKASESVKLLNSFNKTVKQAIEKDERLPAEYRPFAAEFLGVDNPINDIDLGDKAGVKRITKSGVKKLMDFEQVIIKRYLKGKTDTPKMSSSAETPPTEPKKIKNLKEARGLAIEKLKAAFNR